MSDDNVQVNGGSGGGSGLDPTGSSRSDDVESVGSQDDNAVGQVGGGVDPVGSLPVGRQAHDQDDSGLVGNQAPVNSAQHIGGQVRGQDDDAVVQGEGFGGKIQDLPQDPGSLTSSLGKEQEPGGHSETVRMVEMSEEHEMEPEVEGWIEKLERAEDVHLQQPVVHDDKVLVMGPNDLMQDDVIVLPLTHDEVEKGLHAKVYDGARWLAEWCVRILKMFGNRVRYSG